MLGLALSSYLLILVIFLWRPIDSAITVTCKTAGQVALTYDQGPGQLSGRLLDILLHKGVKATFHVSADLMRNTTLVEYVKRAAFEKHTIGLFVPDGVYEQGAGGDADVWASSVPLFEYIHRGANWLTTITGQPPVYVRFGTKRALPQPLRKAIENLGFTLTKAKLEIRDENNKMDSIWNSLGRGLANSSPKNNSFIIRQREIMPNSVYSTDRLIDYIQEKGYVLVPLSECVPPTQKPNKK
jgi:peptidoglycan/xylan/chitin deacetylase (PgdA/CDA1 family)